MVAAVMLKVCPVHNGALEPRAGGAGFPNPLTLNVPGRLVQPATVVVTEYIPVASVEAEVMTGFCNDELNKLGPVQLRVPVAGFAVRLIVEFAHNVAVPPAVGAAGVALTSTFTV